MMNLPREVYVTNWELYNIRHKRILLAILPWNILWKYICVDWQFEEEYKQWKKYITSPWQFKIEIPESEKETITIGKHIYNKEEFETAVKNLKTI